MEDGVLGSTIKDKNRSAHSYMKMLQRRASSSSYNNTDHLPSRIPTNKHSKVIAKQPQKVRIIHIIPPEIIQTDKANFRELVQSLTGRSSSAANIIIKKHQTPQLASSSDLNMSYLFGFSSSNTNSSRTELSPNKKLLNDLYDHHEKLNLDVAFDFDTLTGGFQANDVWSYDSKFRVRNAKVEKEETMLQVPGDTEWAIMKDKLDNGFCIDGFLELDEWLSQDIKLPNLMPDAGSNWGIDRLLGDL